MTPREKKWALNRQEILRVLDALKRGQGEFDFDHARKAIRWAERVRMGEMILARILRGELNVRACESGEVDVFEPTPGTDALPIHTN